MADPRTALNKIPRFWAGAVKVTTADLDTGGITPVFNAGAIHAAALDANVSAQRRVVAQGTITTTTGGEVLLMAPCAGTITAIKFVSASALTKNDTNYISFGVVNKQGGAGAVTVVDSTAAANTTKATGGNSLVAYTPLGLTLTANITVAANDVLALSATVTGTLAGAVNEGVWQVTILPS